MELLVNLFLDIQPFYSIIEDSSTKYGTRDFAKATVSEHGFNEAMKAALALAFTGYDIISNENLLSEVKNEFYKKIGSLKSLFF